MLNGFVDIFAGIEWPSIVIGAIIGAIIPVLCKWLLSLFKKRHEKFHISLSRGESHTYISSTDGDVTVRIRYRDKDYDGTISMLKISLVNDGLNDISFANHFDKPILIRSSSYRIIDAKYVGEPKIKANVKLDPDGVVQITWGLLKKGESISLRLAGEKISENDKKKDTTSFYESLSFSVRSDCVDYITPQRIPFKYIAVLITVVTIVLGSIHYWAIDKNELTSEIYTFRYDGNEYTGYLDYDKETKAYLISSPDSVISKIQLLDFKKYPRVIITNGWNQVTIIIVFYSGLWVFMMLMAVVIALSERKDKSKKVFEE